MGSIPAEFPVPVRPLHAPDENKDGLANFHDDGRTNLESDSRRVLREFLDMLDDKGHEMFKKTVSGLNKDVPAVEKALQETVQEFKGKSSVTGVLEELKRKLNYPGAVNKESKGRDLTDDFQTSEDRLERFKVKKVNVAGVEVAEEEDQT